MTPTTHVLRFEGTIGRDRWRQYAIIRDNAVTVLHLTPAIIDGWNLARVTYQGGADWCGMSADSILAFMADRDGALVTDADGVLDVERRAPEILAARAESR